MKRIFHIPIPFFLLLLLVTCAKISSPTGGPKDITPPVVEKTRPLNYSTGYRGKRIEITFDEFIRPAAIGQELIVSPPTEEKPEIRMRGKTLVIEWQEDLHDSTTYTFSFGESIQDLNEGNVLKNYEFVFSTGDHLDSLAVLGTALQAFNHEPHKEKVFLMLYSDLRDSAPLLEIPDYVGRADENGNFLINNVRQSVYRLFALQDLNRNFKYDVPEEYIGFLDTTLNLRPELFETLYDSVRTGTGSGHADSILGSQAAGSAPEGSGFSMADTALVPREDSITLADLAPWSIFVNVFLFQEDKLPQYLIDNTRKDSLKLNLRFNRRVTEPVTLDPYDFEPEGDWYILEEHVMHDTFDYWIMDSLVYKKDSLTVLATYFVTDSLMNLVPFHDTLKFNYREPARQNVRRRRQKEEEEKKEDKLVVSLGISGGQEQDPYNPVTLEMEHPLGLIDTTRISLTTMQDTLVVPVDYSIRHDSVKLRRYFLNAEWEGQSSYKLSLYPGSFTDIYGLTNDTIIKQIRIRNPEYYGRLLLTLQGVHGQKILQILDSKKNPVRQLDVSTDGLVEFPHLPPATYSLKLIHDSNGNGKWDTGEYLLHRQPEAIDLYPGSFTIRSNFDVEMTWDLSVPSEQEP